jgi:hypothetical protein
MLPWDELLLAQRQVEEARRRGDHAAEAVALGEVVAIEWRLGWLLPLLLTETLRSEDARGYAVRLLDRFELVDGHARDLCEDLGQCVAWAAAEVSRLRTENWELAAAVNDLRRRVEILEHEREPDARAAGWTAGAAGRGGQRSAAAGGDPGA